MTKSQVNALPSELALHAVATKPRSCGPDGGKPVSHPSRLWAQLPTELKERVVSFCGGPKSQKDVRYISQVNDDWLEHVRWAQPATFARQQQQLMLMTLAEGVLSPIEGRVDHHLRHCGHIAFDLVPKRPGLQAALHGVSSAALTALTKVLPEVTSVNLVGLREGPGLFASWAQRSEMMACVRTLGVDRDLMTTHGLSQLAQVAEKMPHLERLIEQGTCRLPWPSRWHSEKLWCKKTVLDFTPWQKLAHVDLRNCGLWLGGVVLRNNSKLTYLNVSGNLGVDELLIKGNGPGASLQTLVLSADYWNDHIFEKIQQAAWAKNLLSLTFVGEQGGIARLNLGDFPALVHLDLQGQDLDHTSISMQPGRIETLNISKTRMSDENALPAGSFAQDNLWRLLLHFNHLTGMLGTLDVFAAKNLRVLDLSKCALGHDDIAKWYVPKDNQLTHLELSENLFSGNVLALLKQKPLPQLRYLGLRIADEGRGRSLSVALLRHGSLRKTWPLLQSLSLWLHKVKNPKTHGDVLDLLERDGISLTEVNLSEVANDTSLSVDRYICSSSAPTISAQ